MTARTTRRRFVAACAAGGAALLALGPASCASVVLTRVTPINGRVRLRIADHPELARRGGALRLLPDGMDDPLLVLVHDDGTFLVLSSVCTHLGCTVDAESTRLVCPCHGSTYDRSGRVLIGPAEHPLMRFASRVSADGMLEIDLGGTP